MSSSDNTVEPAPSTAGEIAQSPLAAWVSPEAVEINLGRAQTANTNSNFDGLNYSS